MKPELRTHVKIHRAEGSGKDRKYVAHEALVIGVQDDLLTLAFINPDSLAQLGGVNWTDAFEQVFSVPHKDADSEGHYYYTTEPARSDEEKKLQAFLLTNFKSETGNETPVDCAIRLLGKAKKK